MDVQIINDDCKHYLLNVDSNSTKFDFTFLDPPFNQGKSYRNHNDCMLSDEYWNWMKDICSYIYNLPSSGAAIYFMQREKNAEYVMRVLRESGWVFQNFIV